MTDRKHKNLLKLVLIAALALVLTFAIVACDRGETEKIITGVDFSDATYVYDGEEHSIVVDGTLPEGVNVKYHNNTAADVGEYTATAVLSGEGYKPLILTAKLTILAKDVTGVTFSDLTVDYDGNEHTVEIAGTLPDGVSVTYKNNAATQWGEYTATATLSGKGYKTLVLTAKLTIAARDIEGVTFNDLTVDYDGNEHTVEITGTLPDGVSVTYENNVAADAGVYSAAATIYGVGYKTLVLNAKLTVNSVSHVVVKTADELLSAVGNGGLIILDSDITLDNGDFIAITKDTKINGMGHTVNAVGYDGNYRILNISGADVSNVTIENITLLADKQVQYLRGINLYETENLTLNINRVNVKLCDYYALNLLGSNVDLVINISDTKLSAWAAVYNRASGVVFNAENCVFEGTNIHNSPNSSSNYFTTFIMSEYVLLNSDDFVAENLSANNRFTLTDCEIVSKIAQDDNGKPLDTKQRLIDIRSPYNNKLELVNCTLTRASEDDSYVYSAYDSKYIPDANRDDADFAVDTNKIVIDGIDETENSEYVEKYLDS